MNQCSHATGRHDDHCDLVRGLTEENKRLRDALDLIATMHMTADKLGRAIKIALNALAGKDGGK